MADARVPLDPLFATFGVPATVTPPNETAIETTVVWPPPSTLEMPAPGEFSRREPQRVMALRRDEVPRLPRGTIVLAPETLGAEVQRWRVDGIDQVEVDLVRVIVVSDPEVDT